MMEMPLQDWGQILESRRLGDCPCVALQERIRRTAGEIHLKIVSLCYVQTELRGLLSRWQDGGGRKPSSP
jgi:hypothetical protein